MGSYRDEDEALTGLARQLADAYGEARSREDQDYACEAISEFLGEFREVAPGEALIAFLDLPLTAETYPLVDEAQTTLAGRGAEVVEPLLEAAAGRVYDADGPAPERAAETLRTIDRRAAVAGLVGVLCSHAHGDVKGAALEALTELGAFAEPALTAAADDPVGAEWVRAALEQLRYEAVTPEGPESPVQGAGVPDDAGELFEDGGAGEGTTPS
jgi:hypothetical protein